MNQYRWNPYLLLTGESLDQCFCTHFAAASKVLLIMSKGFDVRMNLTLKKIRACSPEAKISIMLVNFDEGEGSSSLEYEQLVNDNISELKQIIDFSQVQEQFIQLWHYDGQIKRRVGDRKAAGLIDNIVLEDWTDIIVDISALPRGIYFSLIGKLLTLIDAKDTSRPNLLITVAENPELDRATRDDTPDDEPNFLQGFSGQIDQSAGNSEQPLIWMPILGEEKGIHIRAVHTFLAPNETCPVLPFPSRDPHRPDALMVDYHALLFDELMVEEQNIMYVPEHNPFEAYRILSKAIQNYSESLKTVGESKFVLSTFSSKLLSIGTLLAAYELKSKEIGVGVLNLDSSGYKMEQGLDLEKMKQESNLFVIWLIGEPYDEK